LNSIILKTLLDLRRIDLIFGDENLREIVSFMEIIHWILPQDVYLLLMS